LQWNETYTFNVTALVQDIINSGVNDGFKLSLVSETIYKNILWASSDDANPNLWPELYVEYRCCDPNFTFCSNSQYPNTWTFTADDPTQPYTYKWDFGDATGATGPSATHTYMAPGSYTVCLYLVDADGKVACEKCITICIKDIVEPPKDDPNGPKEASKMSNDDAAAANVTTGIMPVADGTVVITGISPNPAHSNLDVQLRLVTGGNVDYKVYSLDGKTLMSGTKRMDKGAQSLSLSVERLPAGMYILELNDQYTKVNHKFSKE
jgi:PKD repeat protein